MNETPEQRTAEIKRLAQEAGFARVGVALPHPAPEDRDGLRAWLDAGYHGEMGWMADTADLRLDPERHLPGCRSLVVLSVPYDQPAPLSTEMPHDSQRGWISRYAWGDDYHDVIRVKLRDLEARIQARFGEQVKLRSHTDSGPVLERPAAVRAGLGWIGKNGCVIDGGRGSFHFLAVVLTDLELIPDQPVPNHCGTCKRCIEACPTGALTEAELFDSHLCLSYQNIESHEEPTELHGQIYGCDICQDVCPWNRKARADEVFGSEDFAPLPGLVHPKLEDLAELHRGAFRRFFKNSPLRRRGLRRFRQSLAALKKTLDSKHPTA